MKKTLIISGLTLLLAVVPAVAQRGSRGGGTSRGGGSDGRGSGMGTMRGGMSGGIWDRMHGSSGDRSRDGMSGQSRGEMGRQDSGRGNAPRTDGMDPQRQGEMRGRSPGDSGQPPAGNGQHGSGTHDMKGSGSVGGMGSGPDNVTSNRNSAGAPRDSKLDRNREQVQQESAQQGHERQQQY